MIREDEKNGVLFFDYNMARGEFEKKLYNMFVKEDYSLDTIISWAISYGELHNHWISVEDELPKEEGKYLIYTKSGQQIIVNYDCHRGKWHQFNEAFFTPTHWMPLPQAPKGGEK